jgi:hypothetical protein
LRMGIEGNEEADALANQAADPLSPNPSNDPAALLPTVSGIRSYARTIKDRAVSLWWTRSKARLSDRYKRWSLDYNTRPPKELDLPRSVLHRLLAMRSGHGDFRWYHDKFRHLDATLECVCGSWKAPEHIAHCRRIHRFFHAWPLKPKTPPKNRQEGLSYLKTLQASPLDFSEFLRITGFYSNICL